MQKGQLIVVVGPSGAGKDTLLDGAKSILSGDDRYYFPRREITRPADAGGEMHIAITPEQFEIREQAGEYALSWQAHDTCYGVPRSIGVRIKRGVTVVVNTSRTIIDDARRRYPGLTVIQVVAPPEVLAERISARRRESASEVQSRLAQMNKVDVSGSGVVTIVNDGALEDALEAFIGAITNN